LSRALSATALTIVFLLAVAAFVMVLVPILQSQVLDFADRLPRYLDLLRGQAEDMLALVQARMSPEDVARLRDAAGGLAGGVVAWMGRVATQIWSGGLALVNLLSMIVITPIVAFYLLRDWDRIITRLDHWLPRRHRATIREQLAEIDRTLAGFARGQAIVCGGLGVFYGIGLTLAGLEFGLIVGLGTGLISFVPYFGMLTGLAVGMGLALAQFDTWLPIAAVAGIFVAGQIIEGNFVTPKLVGEQVGLHPVWMIFALLAGGALFGFVGVLLSVPAAATIGVLLRFGLDRYLASPLYGDGEDPDQDQDGDGEAS
jgi:predicted PurR-regulated permease PerM